MEPRRGWKQTVWASHGRGVTLDHDLKFVLGWRWPGCSIYLVSDAQNLELYSYVLVLAGIWTLDFGDNVSACGCLLHFAASLHLTELKHAGVHPKRYDCRKIIGSCTLEPVP